MSKKRSLKGRKWAVMPQRLRFHWISSWKVIIPDQKVASGAWLKVVVHGSERTSVSARPNGGCVPANTPTLKSVEVQNGGFQSEEDSTLEATRSLLFIEVGKCRAVVRHMRDRRLRNRKKCNHRWDIRGNVGREMLSNVAGHLQVYGFTEVVKIEYRSDRELWI